MSVNGRASLARNATLVAASSLLGGLVALGRVALTGDLGGGTTTVVRTSPAPTAAAQVADDKGLSVSEIYARAAPGVVQITSTDNSARTRRASRPASRRRPRRQQALGSGFVLDKAGHIVTNYHVIEGADQIEVSFSNQDTLRATLVGSDPSTDLAVLRVEASSRSLTPLVLGNSGVGARRRPGGRDRQPVRARPHRDRRDRQRRPGAHDHGAERLPDRPRDPDRCADQQRQLGWAAAERSRPGDRRQLADRAGAAARPATSASASPSRRTPSRRSLPSWSPTGRVDRAYLGIAGATVNAELARVFRLPVDAGVLVEDVGDGTPAARAGVKPGTSSTVVAGESYTLGGDLIVAVAGKRVSSLGGLRDVLADHKPGETVKLQIYRGNRQRTLDVTLGRQPSSQG